MTSAEELEIALGVSIDCMRMVEQTCRTYDFPILADLLRQQADKNMSLLLPVCATMNSIIHNDCTEVLKTPRAGSVNFILLYLLTQKSGVIQKFSWLVDS